MPEQTQTMYALLIGIDYYQTQKYPNLEGCVHDIDLVAGYLENTVHIPSERTWKLTAPNPETSVLSTVRASTKPNASPTYENIVNAFREVTETAQSGDFVYIHYSGHGGRAATIYPELKKGENQYDEGLVPVDIGQKNGRYLRGVELATLLKRMTDKGLVLTVILDSCHSGGATRGDKAIRGSTPDLSQRPTDCSFATREELISNWLTLSEGAKPDNAGVLPAKDYVLLAACRPTEFAYEYSPPNSEKHGALTYWMINTLGVSPSAGLSFKSLHDRISAKIQSEFSNQQSPMLLGDGTRSIFGSDQVSTQYTVTVKEVDKEQKQVTLDSGLAQGLGNGARFAVYPFNGDLSNKQQQLAIVEIIETKASTSFAKVLGAEEGGIVDKGDIEQGASALMVAAPVALVRRVRLFEKQVGVQENELPLEFFDKQKSALEAVRQALLGNSRLIEVKPGDAQEADYQVAVGRNGEYEICMGMPIKNLRPTLMIDEPKAAQGVVNRLFHLAQYQSVKALDNPASEIANCLEFDLCDEEKQPFSDSSNITVKNGTAMFLRIKNTSYQTFNIAILDLEPNWAISQMPIRGLESPFHQLQSREELFIGRFRIQVPKGEGYEQATETLKLFATRGMANFQSLTQSPLDEEPKKRGNLDKQLEEKAQEMRTRGEAQPINPLNSLLSAIGADTDISTPTRGMQYDPDPNAEWATKQIHITVQQ
jgi:Caspase domain